MRNLLKETIDFLSKNGKTLDDICFVQFDDGYLPDDVDLSEFLNVIYEDGFGWQEINYSMKIVGYDWWLERAEYDGAEWWEFKKMPVCMNCKTNIKTPLGG